MKSLDMRFHIFSQDESRSMNNRDAIYPQLYFTIGLPNTIQFHPLGDSRPNAFRELPRALTYGESIVGILVWLGRDIEKTLGVVIEEGDVGVNFTFASSPTDDI